MFVQVGPGPHIPFPPVFILYAKLVANGAPKFFKALAQRLSVLDKLFFADLHLHTTFKPNTKKIHAALIQL